MNHKTGNFGWLFLKATIMQCKTKTAHCFVYNTFLPLIHVFLCLRMVHSHRLDTHPNYSLPLYVPPDKHLQSETFSIVDIWASKTVVVPPMGLAFQLLSSVHLNYKYLVLSPPGTEVAHHCCTKILRTGSLWHTTASQKQILHLNMRFD